MKSEASLSFVIIAGQFPPPLNGFTYITQEVTKTLHVNNNLTVIDIASHIPNNSVLYHLYRLILTLKGIWTLFCKSFNNNRRFYVACEGGLGLVYTTMLCTTARALGFPIYIHHHSFAYIEDSKVLMACLLRVLGKRAVHIFLCPVMAQYFACRYRRPIKSLVVSNSAFVDAVHVMPRIWKTGKPLAIGLLSNLNNEKGLGLFLEVLRGAASEGLSIMGVLAGPPVSNYDRNIIIAAKQKLGEKLDYRGPVYGKDKADFFNSIDVFVFPTRYANEAQPTVIFEAMAHGVPVLSYDRGCIRGQIGACGATLERDGDFIAFALDRLKTYMASPMALQELKLETKAAFLDDRAQAKQRMAMLFDLQPLAVQPSPNRG
ncbi:MAG: glycosyltransferase family 4 protein [Desulfocapsaceae bacterium]|nr:glycosyltransferase family 4 protein [Desulfocapsaceae bacterium]